MRWFRAATPSAPADEAEPLWPAADRAAYEQRHARTRQVFDEAGRADDRSSR